MPLKRDNADERIARIDLLMEEYRVKHEALAAGVREAHFRMQSATVRAKSSLAHAHASNARRKRG